MEGGCGWNARGDYKPTSFVLCRPSYVHSHAGKQHALPAAKMAAFPDSVSRRQNTCARALTGKAAVPTA